MTDTDTRTPPRNGEAAGGEAMAGTGAVATEAPELAAGLAARDE